MNLSEKITKYIGLVVPFTCCPIGEPIGDCPFIQFWNDNSNEDREKLLEQLPEEQLDKLQKFHDKCLREKIKLAGKYPNDDKYSKVNLKDHFRF